MLRHDGLNKRLLAATPNNQQDTEYTMTRTKQAMGARGETADTNRSKGLDEWPD